MIEDSDIDAEEMNKILQKEVIEEKKPVEEIKEIEQGLEAAPPQKKVPKDPEDKSPEMHKLLTRKFVLDVKPSNEYSFVVDERMMELSQILTHHMFETKIMKTQDSREQILDQLNGSSWVILTKSIEKYKMFKGNNRVFFNFKHTMPPFDQFNGLMKQLKLPFKTQEDIMDKLD